MGRLRLGLALAVWVALAAARVAAFELAGHEAIEAVAYKRLLALDAVPSVPGTSGHALLASLIATGVLYAPPCFDRAHPLGDCAPAQRLTLPLRFWPVLGSGRPDLVIDRQLGERGQCQHFMARTGDGLTPIDPRYGVPGGLVGDAYRRCIAIAGALFDGILRDPLLAQWRLVGTYALMHAIEDAFSAAHVQHDDHGAIVHLRSWTLIDWPLYFIHGRFSFPSTTHHDITDARDQDYLRWDAQARDGRPCRAFLHPYAVPEECLTARALAAVDAVQDFLVLIYRMRATAVDTGRPATILAPSPNGALWLAYLDGHLHSAAIGAELPTTSAATRTLPRADLFLGAQGKAGPARGRPASGRPGSSSGPPSPSCSASASAPASCTPASPAIRWPRSAGSGCSCRWSAA